MIADAAPPPGMILAEIEPSDGPFARLRLRDFVTRRTVCAGAPGEVGLWIAAHGFVRVADGVYRRGAAVPQPKRGNA